MNSNRLYNGNEGARAEFRAAICELSADQINPIAFSKTLPFRQPKYALFAEIRHSAMLGDFVYYSICKASKPGKYDHSQPIYVSSSFEDICDEWSIFKEG